ncbi:MAG: polyphosphate polymerase domain-containing protein [Flavobacteriia bacterium]|nr:polyphosphate polymerase domain-containing protein [Flavobacteriia bacterium]
MTINLDLLNEFNPISLEQMDNVALMDRVDTKFIFNQITLSEILNDLKEDYSVLEINQIRAFQYHSLYFDTPDFKLFYNHHRGKTSRFKFRFRSYIESKLTFFEVKYKDNKGRTKKSRIKENHSEYLLNENTNIFLNEKSTFKNIDIEEKIWVNYKRITLVNNTENERVTIDMDIEFLNQNETFKLENIVLAEVKQDKQINSVFKRIMHKKHIRPGSISKYCLGICFLYKNLIHNNFKPYIHQIQKFTKKQLQYA